MARTTFRADGYSYDETQGDLALEHFSIANDFDTLIPFIKAAQRYQPTTTAVGLAVESSKLDEDEQALCGG